MKKFFADFKKFISRGNILDLAVGVIVGGAFTAIVTALTNHILRPVVNVLIALIAGGDGLDSALTFLKKAYTVDANGEQIVDLANSIYIDWGAFVSAVLDFLIIAFTIFMIIKIIAKSKALVQEATDKAKKTLLTKEQRKELKAQGISLRDKVAVVAYLEAKHAEEERVKAEEAEKARLAEEEAKKNSTEYLLKEIRDLLAENKSLKEQSSARKKTAKE